MKKINIFISILLITFILFLYILYTPKDYKLNYSHNDYVITESYNTKNNIYNIIIKYKNLNFPVTINSKYNIKRKIVDNIELFENNNEICLTISVQNKEYPVCYENDQLKDFRLLSEDVLNYYQLLIEEYSQNIIKTFKNINIYNFINKKYFIWNYKGYDFISRNQNKTIKLLESDDYNNSSVYRNDKYIIIPDYDEKYYFTKLLIIDVEKLESFTFDLGYEISYSSYYLGEVKNNIYLVDKKNKKQYKINIKNEIIEVTGTEKSPGIIYTNGKFENISLNKLVNKQYSFPKKTTYDYQIIDNNLYLIIEENKILLSNHIIKELIYHDDDEIYYLVNDMLYMYSFKTGEVKLLENSEWNFNYDNKIFIFD